MSDTQLEQLIELSPEIAEDNTSSEIEAKPKTRVSKAKKEPLPETATHFTVFQGKKSVFSMQYPQGFQMKGKLFKTVEQYLLYKKAILFNDLDAAQRIFETESATEQKKLATQVKDVDKYRWDKHSLEYLYEANRAKFIQNSELKEELFATRGTLIVEASPTDKHWACGLSSTNSDIYYPKTWLGDNLLGRSLTTVREDLYSGLEMNKIMEEATEKYLSIIGSEGGLPDDMNVMLSGLTKVLEEVLSTRQSDSPYQRWTINIDSNPEPVHITIQHHTDDLLGLVDLNLRPKTPPPIKGVPKIKVEKLKETSEEKRERKPDDYQFVVPEDKFIRTYPITLMMLHTIGGNVLENQVAYWRDIQDLEEAIGMRTRDWQKGYHLTITNDPYYVEGDGSDIIAFGTQKQRGRVAGTLTMRVEDIENTVSLRGSYPTDKWVQRNNLFYIAQQALPIGWR